MNWLYTKWWKWLCVVLMIYIIVGGMLVPLGPGITKVEPNYFKPDSIYVFSITTANSHFKSTGAGQVQIWLKNGNNYFVPSGVNIKSDNSIDVSFAVNSIQQDSLRTGFDVVINNDLDGTFALCEAITFIKAPQPKTAADILPIDSNSFAGIDILQAVDVEVKHNKHQFLAFPYREILYQTIRNTFYHVPMWFAMTALIVFSLIASINYLRTGDMRHDVYANAATVTAVLFGICGLLTGMMWANYTWGQPWVNDPKLNGAAVGVMIYFAYIILRGSITDEIKRARISATYNVFALVIFMLFIFIIPRLTDSLHPGNGGNPAFSKYDLDNSMRMFFYPACIAWILLSFWITAILIRIDLIEHKQQS